MNRLSVKITKEEKGYFANLYQMACKDGDTKVEGKEGAAFLKKSNLPRDVLKNIWMIAAQTNLSWLERDEFYVALRLIALAQSNMPYDEKSIMFNEPLPPLPKFDLKIKQEVVEEDWSIIPEAYKKYDEIFEKYKDKAFPYVINFQNAYNIFNSAKTSPEIISKAIQLIGLQKPNEGFTKQELIVILHIINKTQSDINKVPVKLPEQLKAILFVKQEEIEVKIPNTKPNPDDIFNSELIKMGFQQEKQLPNSVNNQKEQIVNNNNFNRQSQFSSNPASNSTNYYNNNLNKSVQITYPTTNESIIMNDFVNNQNIKAKTSIQDNFNMNSQENKLLQSSLENTNLLNSIQNQVQKSFDNIQLQSTEEFNSLKQQLELDNDILIKVKNLLDNKLNEGKQIDNQIKNMKNQILDVKRQINITLDNINQIEKENQRKNESLVGYKSKLYINYIR